AVLLGSSLGQLSGPVHSGSSRGQFSGATPVGRSPAVAGVASGRAGLGSPATITRGAPIGARGCILSLAGPTPAAKEAGAAKPELPAQSLALQQEHLLRCVVNVRVLAMLTVPHEVLPCRPDEFRAGSGCVRPASARISNRPGLHQISSAQR